MFALASLTKLPFRSPLKTHPYTQKLMVWSCHSWFASPNSSFLQKLWRPQLSSAGSTTCSCHQFGDFCPHSLTRETAQADTHVSISWQK